MAFLVGFKRLKTNTGIGDGGDERLARRIRVHGNLIENAPIFLILLVLLELTGTGKIKVAALGFVFVLGRLAHAIGYSQSASPTAPLRAVGGGMSALSIVITAAIILSYVVRGYLFS